MLEMNFHWALVKQLKLLFFSLLVILPCCAGLFHNEDAAVHVISQKTQFLGNCAQAIRPHPCGVQQAESDG